MIELSAENSVVRVCETGGRILSWKVDQNDILLPVPAADVKRMDRIRGGLFVCGPRLGFNLNRINDELYLGVLRTVDWINNTDCGEGIRLDYTLQRERNSYTHDINHKLRIKPGRNSLSLELQVEMPGELSVPTALVNYGFVSYWRASEDTSVQLGEATTESLEEIIRTDPISFTKLNSGERSIKISSGLGNIQYTLHNFEGVILWSGSGQCVCVAPIMGNFHAYRSMSKVWLCPNQPITATCYLEFYPA